MKKAILIAMADEPPFDEIKRSIYPKLTQYYERHGFDVFFVYGRRISNKHRAFRRRVEQIRWGRHYVWLRLYDLLVLSIYKFSSPAVKVEDSEIRVDLPEDLRHLSVKILHSLNWLENEGYEIVVRSTVSSIINVSKLKEITIKLSGAEECIYAGRVISQSDGFVFVSGSFTVFNSHSIKILFQNRSRLDYSLIDDVCFGRLFSILNVKCINLKSIDITSFGEMKTCEELREYLHIRCKTGVFYRNDSEVMEKVCSCLY